MRKWLPIMAALTEDNLMPKPNIDKDSCIGCGLCIGSHPEIFAFDDEGKADVIAEGDEEAVADAIANCPVQAISD